MTCVKRLSLTLVAALAGCTETVTLAPDPLASLVALEMTPADATITITDLGGQPLTLQFETRGRFSDGTLRDITSLVTWRLDNGLIGSIDARGLFTASHTAAGRGTVRVEARGLEASTALTVKIDVTVIDTSFPPPAGGLFAPGIPIIDDDPTNAPTLIYPANGTTFPQSITSTLFQYQRGGTNDAFRLLFQSDVLRLAIETGADRWQAEDSLQRLLARTALAGAIAAEIHATSSFGPAAIYRGNAITMSFTREAPGGAIFFWSAATSGIMRGGVDMPVAGKLYPGSSTCVGCHAISRAGNVMAMGYDNTTSIDLHAVDFDSLATRIAPAATRPMGWATFSPTGDRVLVANNGILTLYDSQTGASLGTVPLPAMRYATHPDWSPDGNYIAVALTSQTPNNLEVKAASIARIPYNAGAWGSVEILIAGANTNNNYFPKWSPDGAFIAYVNATSASQGAPSAELRLVPGGGGTPVPLRIASHRVGTQDDVPGLANTMPSWGPREGERTWLAFVSARPYGAVLPTSGRGQIWVTSLDLAQPGDSSSAAFWLPCQDVTVLNNNPVWSNSTVTQ